MQCSACGFENRPGLQFCERCAIELVDAAASVSAVAASSAVTIEPSESTTGDHLPCHDCGHGNPRGAHFCEDCGVVLVEVCPNCQGESRVAVKFCATCGVDKKQFDAGRDALEKTKKLLNQQKYAMALKRSSDGLATGYFEAELTALRDRSQELDQKLESLRAEAKQCLLHDKLEKCMRRINQALELSSSDSRLKSMLDEVEAKIRDRDVDLAIERAKRAVEETKDFKAAIAALKQLAKLAPKHPDRRKLEEATKQLADRYHELASRSKDLLREGDIPKAIEVMQQIVKAYPTDHETETAISAWQTKYKHFKAAIAEATEAQKTNDYPTMISAYNRAVDVVPHHPQLKPIQDKAREFRDYHDAELEKAKPLIRNHRYRKAIDHLRGLLEIYPWDQGTAKSIAQCEEKITLMEGRKKTAQQQAEKKRWAAAIQSWEQALEVMPSDEEAKAGLAVAKIKVGNRNVRRTIAAFVIPPIVFAGVMVGLNHYHLAQARAFHEKGDQVGAARELESVGSFGVWGDDELRAEVSSAMTQIQAKSLQEEIKQQIKRLTLTKFTPILAQLSLDEARTEHDLGLEAIGNKQWPEARRHLTRSHALFQAALSKADQLVGPGTKKPAKNPAKTTDPSEPDETVNQPDGKSPDETPSGTDESDDAGENSGTSDKTPAVDSGADSGEGLDITTSD